MARKGLITDQVRGLKKYRGHFGHSSGTAVSKSICSRMPIFRCSKLTFLIIAGRFGPSSSFTIPTAYGASDKNCVGGK